MEYASNPNGHCLLCTAEDSSDRTMAECSKCKHWFHISCVGLELKPSKKEVWNCIKCNREASELKKLRKELEALKSAQQNPAAPAATSSLAAPDSALELIRMQFEAQMQSQRTRDEAYQKALTDLVLRLETRTKLEVPPIPAAATTVTLPDEITNLLRRQAATSLPMFHGSYKEWPNFKRMYDESKQAGHYSDADNINRLVSHLGKKPKSYVSALLMDPGNEPQVVETLTSIYGQPTAIYNELWGDLNKLKNPRMDNPQTMIDFVVTLGNLVCNMKLINQEAYLNNPLHISEIIGRMPLNIREQWADQEAAAAVPAAGQAPRRLTLEDLYVFMKPQQKRATLLLAQRPNQDRIPTISARVNVQKESKEKPSRSSKAKVGCFACRKADHKTSECEVFRKMKTDQRIDLIKKERLCMGCCNYSNHMAKDCKISKTCNTDGCSYKHHPLLHDYRKEKSRPDKTEISEKEEKKPKPHESAQKETKLSAKEEKCHEEEARTNMHSIQKTKIYFQILPVTMEANGKMLETYAFLDHGSSHSLILKDTAKYLNLRGPVSPFNMLWTNESEHSDPESQRVSFSIKGSNGVLHSMNNVNTIEKLSLPKQTVDYEDLKERYKHLRGLPIQSFEDAKPTLLIGLDHPLLLTPSKQRVGKEGPPAVKTPLGWTIYGNLKRMEADLAFTGVHFETDSLRDEIQKFFSTEEFGVKPTMIDEKSSEEKQAIQIMEKTIRNTGKQYEIGLLWKNPKVVMPSIESYKLALKRLNMVENKMRKNPKFATWYNDKIEEYVKKGYARKLTSAETTMQTEKTFYLPHFAVENPNKSPRLVFDAKAKVQEVSLNSELLTGPDELTSLFGVLIRFREGIIAVAGDIREMFSQVKMPQDDQQALRFLWRHGDSTQTIGHYVMQVMIFGATSSPACAQYVKNRNAELYIDKYPRAVDATKRMYVDDMLDSYNSTEEAIEVVTQIVEINDNAHFELRNFISNDRSLLEALPESRVSPTCAIKEFNEKNGISERVLGVYWDIESDTIKYKIDGIMEHVPTKREVLSQVARIFDPLGLLAHLTIGGKLLMQEIWKEGTLWDERIPQRLVPQWQAWTDNLKSASTLKLARCYSPFIPSTSSIELHVFVDASEDAFAAAAYIRVKTSEGYDTSLIAAKTRVAPTRGMTVPRLELQAAVLGTRLANTIKEETRIKFASQVMWSDSTTVLAWIRSDRKRNKQFVQNRIGEILESTTVAEWRWVPTKLNPADEATRDKTTTDSIWFTSAPFLTLDEENWPKQKAFTTSTTEELKVCKIEEIQHLQLHYNWCSDWQRLKKSVGYWIFYIRKLKSKVHKKPFKNFVTVNDYRTAEKIIIKQVQAESYPEELLSLENNNVVEKQSSIADLNPTMDLDGIMRATGRLDMAHSMSYSARNPIILPNKHYVTDLIIKDYHARYLHQQMEAVITGIRQQFWIVSTRSAVKRAIARCQWCKNHKAAPQNPQMGLLPSCRTTPTGKAFSHTGIDYFGPLEITVRRVTEKRWGALFTCMATRAVHLELAEDLSSDALIRCILSLQYRRGRIYALYSDNGTNMKGASNIFKQLEQRLAHKGIEWHFIPPSAPHFGGVWERMVQEVKKLLKVKLWGTSRPTENELKLALAEIEYILNSRPLTHIPLDVKDDDPLTPNHFLIGESQTPYPSLNDIGKAEATRSQWKKVQLATQHFWDRWTTEYLPKLMKREKWKQPTSPLQVEDVVVFPDEQLKGKFHKGIITDVHKASDGQVRSAKVRVGQNEYERPAVKLSKLDVRPSPEIVFTGHVRRKSESNFDDWAKRQKIDVDKVKELANRIPKAKPKKPIKKAKQHMFAKFLTTAAVLSTLQPANSISITPVDDIGIMFDHIGSYMWKRGVWTTHINTSISPTKDISMINHIHENILRALTRMGRTVRDETLKEMTTSMEQQSSAAIRKITSFNRNRRSKGIFGFLKDILFGGDNIEEEIDAIKTHQDLQLHQVSEAMTKIHTKAKLLEDHIDNKLQNIEGSLRRLNNKYTVREAEDARRRLTESVILANQFLASTIYKYDAIKSHPLTSTETNQLISEINKNLPYGYQILNDPKAILFNWKEHNDIMYITIDMVIVSTEIYEAFKVIPIPSPVNRSIIYYTQPYIAMSHAKRFFYPSVAGERFNSTHLISDQHTIHTELDCIAAALVKGTAKNHCKLQQLPYDYWEVIPLAAANQFVYYTHNPNSIRIHCDNTITPSYYSAVVKLTPNCEIRSRTGITTAYIQAEINKSNTYLRTADNIPHIQWDEIKEQPKFNYSEVFTKNNSNQHSGLTVLAIATTSLTVMGLITACYFIGRNPEESPSNLTDIPLATTPRRSIRRPPPRRFDMATVSTENIV